MVESLRDVAIFTVDPDGRIVTWNPGAESLFGYADREIMNRPIDVIFTPEDREAGIPSTSGPPPRPAVMRATSAGTSARTAAGSSPAVS